MNYTVYLEERLKSAEDLLRRANDVAEVFSHHHIQQVTDLQDEIARHFYKAKTQVTLDAEERPDIDELLGAAMDAEDPKRKEK